MQPIASQQNETYGIAEFISNVWTRKLQVLLIALVFVLATALYMLLNPKPYSVDALIRIDPGIPLIASSSHINDINIESEIETMRSRTMLTQALDTLNAAQPDLVQNALVTLETPSAFEVASPAPVSEDQAKLDMVDDIQKRLFIDAIGHRERSGLVSLQLATRSPAFGKAYLDTLLTLYIKQAYDRNSQSKIEAVQTLETKLKAMEAQLTASEQALKDYQEKNGTLDLETETRINLQQEADVQRQLMTVKTKEREQTVFYQDNYPALTATRNQAKYLEGEVAQLHQRLVAMPEVQRGLEKLKRDAEAQKQDYRLTAEHLVQLHNELASVSGFAQMADAPTIIKVDRLHNTIKMLAASFLGGAFVGVIFVHMWYFSPLARIKTYRQLQQATSLPILGMLHPVRNRFAQKFNLFSEQSLDGSTLGVSFDDFRHLKRNLDYATANAPNNLMLFTRNAEEEEISFITSHVAAFYAQEQKTILVDCNMTREANNPYYTGTHEPGLSQIIAKATSLETSIQKLHIPNLWYLPCGEPTSYGMRLLGSESFMKTLTLLQQVYDRVILNYPPLQNQYDFDDACKHAGSVFFVISSGTNIQKAKNYFDGFHQFKNIKGLVVKDVPVGSFLNNIS